ncbi:transposase family protein, partial [Bacillus smithii]
MEIIPSKETNQSHIREPYSFLERYQRHTKRLLQALLVKVREYNFKQVAKETGLGHSTVIRLFDKYYSYDN